MKINRLVFSPIDVNTYILEDKSGDCAIIDCGCYDDQEFLKLEKFLESKKLKPVLLLNTHCHLDHIFGNGRILARYGLRPYYCELEESNRKSSPQHAMLFGLTMEESPAAGRYLSHGDEISFGSVTLKCLHVPGHTAGTIAFYSENDAMVFTGDSLFAGSIGRTDLPGGNFETLINSIRENLLSLPPDTIVYPGHGQETRIGVEARTNPYLA
jgi:glyoxylase-like metal-dependent hydrolase (beta-lactamase superfamily II)